MLTRRRSYRYGPFITDPSHLLLRTLYYGLFITDAVYGPSAPFNFTKVDGPLVKYWRFNSVKITSFLDDGVGIEYNYEEAKHKSEFVQETLTILTWLGIVINLSPGTLKITKSRIDNVLSTISLILGKIFLLAKIFG